MKPTFMFVQTYYNQFLDDLYRRTPHLDALSFDDQLATILKTRFGVSDAYSAGLRPLGCECVDVVCNADILQTQWAKEHGLQLTGNIHDQRRQILTAQVKHYQPQVLYMFEWSPLGDAFLASIKTSVRTLIGQIASPLPANRTFDAYDLIISSWPPIVDHFRSKNIAAQYLQLGFDERVLDEVNSTTKHYDVSFIGGFAPSHRDRIAWLESLLEKCDIDIFAYGIETVPKSSPIHNHYRGQAWGLTMYQAIAESRMTLNRHARIDIGGQVNSSFANNMRLYEATGVGTCLLTETKDNLANFFAIEDEMMTYTNTDDCVNTIESLLNSDDRREAIAQAGQRRTLADHTYKHRMKELLAITQPLF